MSKSKGKTVRLQLRGKGRHKRLEARIREWTSSGMSKSPDAYHKPGSNKK